MVRRFLRAAGARAPRTSPRSHHQANPAPARALRHLDRAGAAPRSELALVRTPADLAENAARARPPSKAPPRAPCALRRALARAARLRPTASRRQTLGLTAPAGTASD